VDSGIEDGDSISVHYDPMIAKVIATGRDRTEALATLRHRLDRTAIFGVANNLPLLRNIAAHPQFEAGDVDTGFVDRELAALTAERAPQPEALLLAAAVAEQAAAAPEQRSPWARGDAWRAGGMARRSIGLRTPAFLRLRMNRDGDAIGVAGDGLALSGSVVAEGSDRYRVNAGRGAQTLELIRAGHRLQIIGEQADEIALAPAWPFERSVEDADAHPSSPLPGRVVDVRVQAGDAVQRGDVLAIVEGMKMQHAIRAARAGRVEAVLARQGELVEADTVLFDIAPA
jgi:3-methylcrotonyl-CoA carboxylase alpha subunit